MKKKVFAILSLILAAVMLSSCLVIPEVPSETVSTDESGAVSGASDSGDVSQPADASEAVIIIENETVVSVGKSYDMTKDPDSKYPDPGNTKLTDGVYADSPTYSDEHYAGFPQANAASVRITLNMENDYQQIYKFGISYLASTDAGLGPIGACRVFYSMDGEKWSRTNFFIRPAYEEGVAQTAWRTLDKPVDAKFIRFDIKGEKGWLFLDELIVISNIKGSTVSSDYLTLLHQAYTSNSVKPEDLKTGEEDASRETYAPYQITNGARYTASYEAGPRYPDNDDLLTDGEPVGRAANSGAFAGYPGGEALNIDVFLNEAVSGICDFSLAMCQQQSLKYMLPYYVDFYVSMDGKSYDHVGRIFAPDNPAVTNYSFTLHTEKTYSALWIRYALPKTDSKMFLIEEAYAAAYIPDPNTPLYPPVVIDQTDEPENWPSPNKKTVNLAAGLPYQLESYEALYYAKESNDNTTADAGVLTDGKYSPNTVYNNGYWNRTRNGSGRNVYFDFGYVSSVSSFKLNFLSYPSYGIQLPTQCGFRVSMNGKEWYDIGYVSISQQSAGMFPVEYKLKKPVLARFVQISFPVAPHTYCDEIEIYGAKAAVSGAKRPEEFEDAGKANEYLAPDPAILKGSHDTVLIYHNIVDGNENFFLPYVAYLNADGEISDTMFDSYLFLPSTAGLPSGGRAYESEKEPNVWSDWMFLYNDIFKEGKNLDALNKTVGLVKETLGLDTDYKVNVIFTLMYLNPGAKFGDCDGDGEAENLSTLQGRLKVVDHAMKMYVDKFSEMNYEHLALAGFYWFHEAADFEKDASTISGCADLAHKYGTQLCWIPYFKASSYNLWSEMGFDSAVMQPNYVFKDTVPYSQLISAAKLIKNYGLGIEIEIAANALNNPIYTKRYLEYLGHGIEAGYMKDCIHMYYQEGNVFSRASKSKNPLERLIYDATYQFIKGTLTGPAQPDDFRIDVTKGYSTGKICEIVAVGSAELLTSASHGAVGLSPNGNYVYVPYSGFKGEDSFTFRVNNGVGWTEPIKVTFSVG